MIVEEGKLVFDEYHKATFSGRFLNHNLHHPVRHKRVIYRFVDRIVCLCHSRFNKNNLINAINIFLNNGYSLQFIFSMIHNRLKFYIHNKITTTNCKIIITLYWYGNTNESPWKGFVRYQDEIVGLYARHFILWSTSWDCRSSPSGR